MHPGGIFLLKRKSATLWSIHAVNDHVVNDLEELNKVACLPDQYWSTTTPEPNYTVIPFPELHVTESDNCE
jgi:hypothetical protein